eukprot:CAMPEP_0198679964 /NCGR_PEP_ID=MMETSP1468-20131203/3734_1 /TAXON_ID=1461545 /ORGANISM="Mantoniella sp, Strain CCMP1436" /LENGTH=43 /DNA_ID= /DNA_START= /DNA_END= /DNA_ORIENTATION=
MAAARSSTHRYSDVLVAMAFLCSGILLSLMPSATCEVPTHVAA